MRSDKKIDQQGTPVDGDEILIRLLCSPLQYDKVTRQVSIDAFDLRMMGKNHDNPIPGSGLRRGSPETNWGWGAPGGPQVPSCSP